MTEKEQGHAVCFYAERDEASGLSAEAAKRRLVKGPQGDNALMRQCKPNDQDEVVERRRETCG